MAYPKETAEILVHQGYDDDVDFRFSRNSDGSWTQLDWWHADPKPTEQQVWDWRPGWQRDDIKRNGLLQIRQFSDVDKVDDGTLKYVTDHDYNRYKVLVEQLAQTPDQGLDAFDRDLESYEQSEQDYARNIAQQETENLAWDTEIRSAGGEPILSDSERTAAQSRVQYNTQTAKGLQTGIQVPEIGAPRELVTRDGEARVNASFWEISFDWNTQPYYIPKVRLDEIPDGIDPAQVFAMVYDASNVYRSWMPFEQQADETWETPSNVSYISIAKTESAVWRVAVSYQGTTAEYEITSRVTVVPPNSSWSKVRWGGRNGSGALIVPRQPRDRR